MARLDHLSWTRESTFERCGQQYYFRYEEGLKRPPGVALIRGQAPHRSAEADLVSQIERGALLEAEAVAQIATDYVDREFRGEVSIDGEFEGLSLKEAKTRCRDDARKMALLHHQIVAPTFQPKAVEVRVRAEFPELPIPYEGVLDVVEWIDPMGQHNRVRDLKTKTKAPEAGFADCSEQLTVYWGLHSAWRGVPPVDLAHDVLWVTKTGKSDYRPQYTSRTPADWQTRCRRSLRFIDAVEKEIYLPAPVDAWICSPRWCGYTDVCPYYRGRPRPTS